MVNMIGRDSQLLRIIVVGCLISLSAIAIKNARADAQDVVLKKEVPAEANSLRLRSGDRVNLAVFEKIERAEDKWGSSQSLAPDLYRSFIQRPELSGERTVQDDGAIALPFLGQIRANSLTPAELESSVSKAFEQLFRRPAFVTILTVEHSPVFIVGPVKNPGSYKYSAGMTVLHAIALAGGMERPPVEFWQAIEAAHEEARVAQTRLSVARQLARQAVLRAERDGLTAISPPRLVQLVGSLEAGVLINDETALRRLVLAARQSKANALRSAVESAKSELLLAKDRMGPIEANIRLRTDRLNAITSLSATGIASKAQLVEVQNALFDVEGRKQEALSGIMVAKSKLEQAEEELKRFEIENQTQLQLDISTAEKDISENLTTITNSQETLKALRFNPANQPLNTKAAAFKFEILRRTVSGTMIIRADDFSEVAPGDLINVKLAEAGTNEQTLQPIN